jgi:hypothetical protein
MTGGSDRQGVVIMLNREEYRMLCLMLGFAIGIAEERKRADAPQWEALVDRITREMSNYTHFFRTALTPMGFEK